MSYAGPVPSRGASRPKPASKSSLQPGHDTDWQQVAVFGAGLLLGIAVGAGVAILTAPQTGQETRDDLRRSAARTSRAMGRRSRNAWADVQDELSAVAGAISRRKARRAAARELEAESAVNPGRPSP